jgi:ABC-type multidrug transport system permease subunit
MERTKNTDKNHLKIASFGFCGKVIAEPRTHMCFGFKGGDRLKFSDIVIAVASFAVVVFFLSVILGLAMIPAIGWDWGSMIVGMIGFLLSGLIVGAIFSKKIWEEAGTKTMAKIIILGAVLIMLYYAAAIPAQGEWTPAVKETFLKANPGTTLTNTQWLNVELFALGEEIALNMFIGIVLGFIGLYIGSMLRKPKKS